MKLYVGKEAGFCWGVKRAIYLTEKSINESGGDVYTWGPLIHNPQVVNSLTKKGVKIIQEPAKLTKGTIVIRAHGITPQKLEEIKNTTSVNIVDGTCPHVTKSEKKVEEFADKDYHIVIVGDPNHAEVISLQDFAWSSTRRSGQGENTNCSIVRTVEEAKNLVINKKKVFIIAQSTYSINVFYEVINYFKNNTNYAVEFFDSICSEPLKTQEELKKMCEIVDCVIVVGGRNSANTKRLEEIVIQFKKESIRVETASELDVKKLSNFYNIGLTAGASTPDWIIDEIINKIKNTFTDIDIVNFENPNHNTYHNATIMH